MLQTDNKNYFPQVKEIVQAKLLLNEVISTTPIMENMNLSEKYQSKILLKKEDLQVVRSYKIRGAYNKIRSLSQDKLNKGIVCASAGNHAQGVAYSCQKLGVKGKIYMPATTPRQKINQVKMFGKANIEIELHGDTYDAAYNKAMKECIEQDKAFVHPFDDREIIEGQATVGLEILQQVNKKIDYIFVPVGGGGLIAGLGSYFKEMSPQTKIIGVEPAGAPAMKVSLEQNKLIDLEDIDKFVDGAAVKKVGELTFEIGKKVIDEMVLVPEGKVCTTILEMYNHDAIVLEPAGALSISALDFYSEKIKGKNVVCIISGSNNDITRTEEIKERSLLYEGLKHYFIVRFPQRSGALRDFVDKVLGPNDDITHFEYHKKTSREKGPATIGIELQDKNDFQSLIERMKKNNFIFEYLNEKPDLFQFLI